MAGLESFTYEALPARVVFGPGKLRELPGELDRLGVHRALVISTPRQWRQMEDAIGRAGSRIAGIFDGAVTHVPQEVAEAGRAAAVEHKADGLIALGGGSATGLAKAIGLTSGLPIIAIPTTYAGSEVTAIWGMTEGGEAGTVKRTGRDLRVLPRTVIYDPELTLTLPAGLSITSGMNAMAHCVEAFYAEGSNPVTSLIAEEGIRALAAALPAIRQAPQSIPARTQALYGAWLAGVALGSAGVALHHKLCHMLGGSFGLSHAETHTVILPHAVAYNAPAVPEAMERVARALGRASAASGLFDLAQELGAPTSLEELGMLAEDLPGAAELAVANPFFNPQPIEREGVLRLLQRAFSGRRP